MLKLLISKSVRLIFLYDVQECELIVQIFNILNIHMINNTNEKSQCPDQHMVNNEGTAAGTFSLLKIVIVTIRVLNVHQMEVASHDL